MAGDRFDNAGAVVEVPRHRAVCAWCNRVTREGPEPTTHGICPDCKRKLLDPQPDPNTEDTGE